MSHAFTIYTYDWVPAGANGPRGFVRDLRLRWACEEAQCSYTVESVPFKDRGQDHYARQPFGQVPFLKDNEQDFTIFESGAGLLHLARKSEALMPRDPKGEAKTLEWTIAALNSIEMVTVPWWFIGLSGATENPLDSWVDKRLSHLQRVLEEREWLVSDRFTVADVLMADVLRVPKVLAGGKYPTLTKYVERACARPAFQNAYKGQMEHFAKNDK